MVALTFSFAVPFPLLRDPVHQAKIANFAHLARTRGLHFNDKLSSSKAFRNPRIYAKLVEFVNVDETGTNWDKSVWDPKGLNSEATASRIGEPCCSGHAAAPLRDETLTFHHFASYSGNATPPL